MSRSLRYVAALPVWGEFYCDFFLRAGLPGLLLPGNLPAFASPQNFTALIYTRPQDLERLANHPAMKELVRYCDIRFKALPEDIEEFSTDAEGIRRKLTIMSRCLEIAIRAAEEDPDLVALFPLADLIYADGALAEITRRMEEGQRAVGVITPHVTSEAVAGLTSAGLSDILASSRSLLRFTLDHAHHSFRRQFVDSQPFSGRPSQFYVSAGDAGFTGRAIHLHPMAVRPVSRVNQLSASIDTHYYFAAVPDAADRSVIDNSDDALIVECSRQDYLADLPDWDGFSTARLTRWINELKLAPGQRDLLQTAVQFPTGGGDGDLQSALARSEAIVAETGLR